MIRISKHHIGQFQPPATLDVDRVRIVHQDVRHQRVFHQAIQGPESEHLGQQFLQQPLAVQFAQHVAARPAHPLGDRPDLRQQPIAIRQADARQIQRLDQFLMDRRL
jgi:hypothetical protein